MACNNCPRGCKNRNTGYCGVGERIVISRVAPHYWEEPCVSGTAGSGTVFFSGCNLKCVFCQNHQISFTLAGEEVTLEELARRCFDLVKQGVHNLNFVTPTPYIGTLKKLLSEYNFGVPIAYNTSSYESVKALRELEGLVDVYLADYKFSSSSLARAYAKAPDYPQVARLALEEMYRQVGDVKLDENGLITKGVIVRHLVLPECVEQSLDAVDDYCDFTRGRSTIFSLMSQYTPCVHSSEHPNLNRTITAKEYEQVTSYLDLCGVQGYCQELSSATSEYVPEFNTTPVFDIT